MDEYNRPKFITAVGRVGTDKNISVDLSYASQYRNKTLDQVTEEQSVALSKSSSKEILVYELVRVLRADRVVTPVDVEYERKEQVKPLPKPHREI